ncbi:hypothetical protein DEJ37_15920 [Kocuria rosea]|nr:hypothetical protein DEJ37_15920 [Kocuria rosea]
MGCTDSRLGPIQFSNNSCRGRGQAG